MKKNYVRMLALLICAVMVLGMVPGKANAVELEGKTRYQLKSISVDKWGDYLFTNMADLLELSAMADQTGEFMYCIYDSDAPFTINKNLTIPNNLTLVMDTAAVTIPAGVTVAVDGFIVANKLDIYGTVNVSDYGDVGVLEKMNVYGQVNVLGMLSVYDGLHTAINGMENVNFGEYATLYAMLEATSGAHMVELCDIAANAPQYVRYIINNNEPMGLSAPLTIPSNVNINAFDSLEFAGDLLIEGSLSANRPVYLNGKVTNLGDISVMFDEGGRLTIGKPEAYTDASKDDIGFLTVFGENLTSPDEALYGIKSADFKEVYFDNEYMTYWNMTGYKNNPSFHEHVPMLLPEVPADCLMNGISAWLACEDCGEILVPAEELAPLGHDYGLDANGNIDFYDTTCDVCGAERIVNPTRLTHSMYRMYNPNTGEHFYTGDKTERQNLEIAGWKFEGIGFTFPANTGKPVYRLFDPATGEHLYTMDETEVETLVTQGWNMEGVAFNSGNENEVPQYRLHNPNVNVGAYHFTASETERNVLLAAGWEDQGIGFYTCMQ